MVETSFFPSNLFKIHTFLPPKVWLPKTNVAKINKLNVPIIGNDNIVSSLETMMAIFNLHDYIT